MTTREKLEKLHTMLFSYNKLHEDKFEIKFDGSLWSMQDVTSWLGKNGNISLNHRYMGAANAMWKELHK